MKGSGVQLKLIRGSFSMKNKLRKLRQEKVKLPAIIGNEAVNHFKEGFRAGGRMTDASSGGWAKRKYLRRTKSGKISKSNTSGVLIKSGRLRKSLRRILTNWNQIVIGTAGVKYAAIHNYGLMGKAWGRWPFKMPKREFIGPSKKLREKLIHIIEGEFNKVMRTKG